MKHQRNTSSASPPQYQVIAPEKSTSEASPPPEYALQSKFEIGYKAPPKPFVTATELQVHLDLLRAFKELRVKIELYPNDLPEDIQKLSREERWWWFVALAVERYVFSVNILYN
jgi:hypothetical protein